MRTEALRLSHIEKKGSNGEKVLLDVSLCFFSGSLHTVLMQSASGRHALMDILSGNSAQDGGLLYLLDHPYRPQSILDAKKQGIFCIERRSHLVPGLSVAENLFLTDDRYVRLGFTNARKQNKDAAALLSFARLDHIHPWQLAGSLPTHEAHMVEILQAVSLDARVILFDNVFERYSATEMQMALRYISMLKEKGMCVILLLNKYHTPFDVADYAAIVHHGVTVANFKKGAITRNALLGHLNAQSYQRAQVSPPAEKQIVLRLENVTVRGVQNAVNWSVRAGEVTGIWDQEFAHSNELVAALFGKEPSGGTVYVGGKRLKRHSYEVVLKQGLVLIPERQQENYVFRNLNLKENITVMMNSPLYRVGIRSDRMQTFASRHELESLGGERLKSLLEQGRPLPALSRQEQLLVAVAKWLCCKPKVIVFVNPFLLFDDSNIHELQALMDHLRAQGLGVIVFSMNLRELKHITDRTYHFQESMEELGVPGREEGGV